MSQWVVKPSTAAASERTAQPSQWRVWGTESSRETGCILVTWMHTNGTVWAIQVCSVLGLRHPHSAVRSSVLPWAFIYCSVRAICSIQGPFRPVQSRWSKLTKLKKAGGYVALCLPGLPVGWLNAVSKCSASPYECTPLWQNMLMTIPPMLEWMIRLTQHAHFR